MKYKISLDIEFLSNPYKGLYIALEGIDGCGKTTQVKAIKKYFEKSGRKVTVTSEPKVDLPGGEIIMQYFNSEIAISGTAFQFFATANRVVNHEKIVIPSLIRGDVVISDRCFWSALPYGIMDKGVEFDESEAEILLVSQGLLSHFHQFIVPDKVFYIDVSAKTGLDRSLKKKDRRDLDFYEKKDKLEKVVKGYRWLTKQFSNEFIIINGEKSVLQVTKDVLKKLND